MDRIKSSFNYFTYISFPEIYKDLAVLRGYTDFVIYKGDEQFGYIESIFSANAFANHVIYKSQPLPFAKLLINTFKNIFFKTDHYSLNNEPINFISINSLKEDIEEFDRTISSFINDSYTIFKLEYPVFEFYLQILDMKQLIDLSNFLNRKKISFKIFSSSDPLLAFWMGKFLPFKGLFFLFSEDDFCDKLDPAKLFLSSSDFFFKSNIRSLCTLLSLDTRIIISIFTNYISELNKNELVELAFYFDKLFPFIFQYFKNTEKKKKFYKLFFILYSLIKKRSQNNILIIENPWAFHLKDEAKFKLFFKNKLLNYLATNIVQNHSSNNINALNDIESFIFTVVYIDKKICVFVIKNQNFFYDFKWFEKVYIEFKRNIKRKVNVDKIIIEFRFKKKTNTLFDIAQVGYNKMHSILYAINKLNKKFGKPFLEIAG